MDPSRRSPQGRPGAERLVVILLAATSVLAVAFVVFYIVWDDTQVLGLTLGLALASLSAALVVAGKAVVVDETAVEERPGLSDPASERVVQEEVVRGADGVSRRGLLLGAVGAAGATLGAAAIVPAASLGPAVGGRIDDTPWHRGRRVVDSAGRALTADDITPGALVTGYPQGADPRELGSPIVLVRLPVARLRLPAGRDPARWAPEGIVAYSKICTHAGCAVALYRSPLYREQGPPPALVCPCHYSTFDPARGAKRTFGPAGRPLPQLPLTIESGTRALVAGGGFSGSIGPAWWSVDRG